MPAIDLTIDMFLNFVSDYELLLILNSSEDKELFSNYNDSGNEGYKLRDHINSELCKKSIKRISSTDMGEILLILKEE